MPLGMGQVDSAQKTRILATAGTELETWNQKLPQPLATTGAELGTESYSW